MRSGDFFAILLIVVMPLAGIGGAVYFVMSAYSHQRSLIVKEISEIPPFDAEIAGRSLADEMKLPYPVQAPEKIKEDLAKEIDDAVSAMLQKNFNPKDLGAKKMEIFKKYSEAKPGDTVVILAKNVKGEFSGKFYGFDGHLVKIGNMKFRVDDILEDYRYLFDAELADRISREKIAEFESSIQAAKKSAVETLRISLESDIYPKAGYLKPEYAEWISSKDFFDLKLKDEEEKHARERLEKVKEIEGRHKLFGLFRVQYEVSEAVGGASSGTQQEKSLDKE